MIYTKYKNYAQTSNDILKETFNISINLMGFSELIDNIEILEDTDIDSAIILMKETTAWSEYLESLNNLIISRIDKLKLVKEHYIFIMAYMKKEKKIPEIALLERTKLKGRTVGDLILETSNKEDEITRKLKTLKIFVNMTNAYVKFLKSTYYSCNRIYKNHNNRFFAS